MMKWIDVNSGELPPVGQPILCYCPEWSETGYQVARWSEETGFYYYEYYYEEPSEQFCDLVEKWAVFETAD